MLAPVIITLFPTVFCWAEISDYEVRLVFCTLYFYFYQPTHTHTHTQLYSYDFHWPFIYFCLILVILLNIYMTKAQLTLFVDSQMQR